MLINALKERQMWLFESETCLYRLIMLELIFRLKKSDGNYMGSPTGQS